MLNFTENMNRIEYLLSQTLVHVQEKNYQKAKENLDDVHIHTTAAQQQINELEFSKLQAEERPDAFFP